MNVIISRQILYSHEDVHQKSRCMVINLSTIWTVKLLVFIMTSWVHIRVHYNNGVYV